MSKLTEVLEAHQAQSRGSYCKCGKQVPLGGSRGWHTGHLADAIAAAGLAIIELPEPDAFHAGDESVNGYHEWNYPHGSIATTEDGTIMWGWWHIHQPLKVRAAAAALLAAANAADKGS